ncbi:acetyltransferase [Taibaiella lutea]|uniref:Acetyltransferase n=1 Tax=Taibaiella lutea TaxID=2608001 RepID=A0A5M6CHG8_9BACT|nr:acetyltransferase [Taibaiella lutea]KAA5533372.1 acetyltransferase [Taibaiella lutea]
MIPSTIFIFGSGAQGRVIADIFICQYPAAHLFFIDENESLAGTKVNGIEVLNIAQMLSKENNPMVHVAIGNPNTRKIIVERLSATGCDFISAIHPSAEILPSATVGKNCMIGAGVIVNTNTSIADHVLINTRVLVEHDCIIEKYVSLSPGAIIGGRVHIKEGAFIGSAAVLVARITVEKGSIIGMASTVMNDIPAKVIAYGTPAKKVAEVTESYNWSRLF